MLATQEAAVRWWFGAAAWLGGCSPGCRQGPEPIVEETGDTQPPTDEPDMEVLRGSEADDGFGAALAWHDGTLWIGAPHGSEGRLYTHEDDVLTEVLSGEGRLGSALAAGPTGVVVGAPLADGGGGQLLDGDGEELWSAAGGTGLAVWADEGGWLAASGSGWRDSEAREADVDGRPSSVARLGDRIAIGHQHGAVAVQLDDGTTLPRPLDQDGAGYALIPWDADGDGELDWLLGAPEAGEVTAWTADLSTQLGALHGPEAGRFGAALATGDWDGDGIDELLVGAPMTGDEVEGAAHIYGSGSLDAPVTSFRGETPGAMLGFAVAMGHGIAWLGGPAEPGQPGRVESHSAQ